MPTGAAAATPAGTPPRLVVTATSFPPGCQPDEVVQLVTSFLEAFNRGDQEQLARFLPQRLRWYSVTDVGRDGQKRHFVTDRRTPLLAYFLERQRWHEQVQLRELGVSPGSRGDVAIGFTLARRADDLPPGLGGPAQAARGKGGGLSVRPRRLSSGVWGRGLSPPAPCRPDPNGLLPTYAGTVGTYP